MAEIPVFKERRMTGGKTSYLVKDSYKGILRLSPNSAMTLLGTNNGIDLNETTEGTFRYDDSVSTLLNSHFISVSSSDGVELDFKITNNAIEYKNLYILGMLETSGIVCYTNSGSQFRLGDYNMPVTANKGVPLSEGPSEYEEPSIEDLEDTYILVNTAEDGEPANFEYQNVQSIIGSIVAEELTKLSSLPTGSIHWVPVNLAQYEQLLKAPNNSHNSSNVLCDSLIRDFLLCDGSEYNNKDFPELAKILYKEKVTVWDPHDENENYLIKKEVDAVDTKALKFRVPDLRSMFIQYSVPPITAGRYAGTEMMGVEEQSFADSLDEKNKAGKWQIDSSKHARVIIDSSLDKHYHYIVLDNSTKKQHNTPSWLNDEIKLKNSTLSKDDWGLNKPNLNARPLAKYASIRKGESTGPTDNLNTTKGCDTRNCRSDGTNYDQVLNSYLYSGLTVSYGGSSNYCNNISLSSGYILSGSTHYSEDGRGLQLSNYVGRSSYNMYTETNLNVSKINYTGDTNIYNKKKNYVLYSGETKNILRHENTPEFYACLPLIKI